MKVKNRQTIRFLIGAGSVVSAVVGAFCHLQWYYFAVLFAGGCGLMGQNSHWQKLASIAREK